LICPSSSRTIIPKERKRKRWSWRGYYEKTAKGVAWDTLREAMRLASKSSKAREHFAIDLGCGAGRDTLALLRHGWKVLAIDNQPMAIRWIRSSVPSKYRQQLRTRVALFERTDLPQCDLLNASYSLPFCPPERFRLLWRQIEKSIRPGGWFSGHFFGINDEWASLTDMTFHSRKQVKFLLRHFKMESFSEKEWEGTTSSGRKKHWHVFSVVARKFR